MVKEAEMRIAIRSTLALFFLMQLTAAAFPQGTVSSIERLNEQRRRSNEAALERRMQDMRALDQLKNPPKKMPEVAPEPTLSKQAKDRVLRVRRVEQIDIAKYDKLLGQEGTGIFKLFPDRGCQSKSVISVSMDCEKFVPLSSSFTFRSNEYINPTYHDIYFENDKLVSKSFFLQGIFVSLGDVPIEDVSLGHAAMNFLNSFHPATRLQDATDDAHRFDKGIESGNYRYSDNIVPAENTTYILRTIAYRLNNPLRPLGKDSTMSEIMFLSLTADKRDDVTVAFRVIRRDELGGLTIVWKELARQDASKIKIGKNESLADFHRTF